MKIEVKFEYFPVPIGEVTEEEWQSWLTSIESMPGMVENGKTKEEAFTQLMKSLMVKIMYDNGISANEALTWNWTDTVPINQ